MASPQLENGYTRTANELFEKLYQFPMGYPQLRVVLWILRFTYGFHQKRVHLSVRRIAREIGMDRKNCMRAIQVLLDNGIIDVDAFHGVGVIKDWESWGGQGDPGVTPTQGEGSRRPQSRGQGDPPLKKRKKENKKTPIGPQTQKRKTGVPDEFPILSNHLVWIANTFGEIPMELIERERDAFLDRHAAIGSKFVSWDRAFQTWMRNWYFKFGGKEEVHNGPKLSLEEQIRLNMEQGNGES